MKLKTDCYQFIIIDSNKTRFCYRLDINRNFHGEYSLSSFSTIFSPIVITLFQEFGDIVKIDQDLRSKEYKMLSSPVLGLLFESNRQRYNGDLKKKTNI